MKRLSCLIEIGAYEFKTCNNLEINSSYETLTDTATITIPRKLKFQDQILAGDGGIFKVGDVVNIFFGYDYKNVKIFEGYVASIKPGTPVEITVEDEMYALKKATKFKPWKGKKDLKTVLSEIAPNNAIQSVSMQMQSPNNTQATQSPAKFIDYLNRTFALKSWFREKKLYVGLAYWPELQQTPAPVFEFNNNIIDHDLTYVDADSVRLKVTATSLQPDNTSISVEVGDPEGESRTLHYYNMTKSELQDIAERDMQRMRYSGWRGSFTTFGIPVVKHGDKIELRDPKIADRNGLYIVKAVTTTFGQGGYRQSIELDVKV